MTGDEHRRLGLLFLLSSSGCLGLPRFIENGDEGAGSQGDEGETTVAESTTAVGTTPGVPPEDTSVSTLASVSISVGEVASEPPEPPEPPEPRDLPLPLPDVCVAYGDTIAECYDEAAGMSAAGYCADALGAYERYYGVECAGLLEEVIACLSALDCEELTGGQLVCQEEFEALELGCG